MHDGVLIADSGPLLGLALVDCVCHLQQVEVIQLGADQPGALLLIDDYRARRTAEALGLKCTGAAGVLVRAKKMGLIEHVHPLLARMRENGYYISDSVVRIACQQANESFDA